MRGLRPTAFAAAVLTRSLAHAERIYGANTSGGIYRANLDGSGTEFLVSEEQPLGIAVNPRDGKLYWTSIASAYIRRANLDGSAVETIVDDLRFPNSLTLDPVARKIYWTDNRSHLIQRADLDGANVEILVDSNQPLSIALDLAAGKMYWVNVSCTKTIQRANLDGSDEETLRANCGIYAPFTSRWIREPERRTGLMRDPMQSFAWIGMDRISSG